MIKKKCLLFFISAHLICGVSLGQNNVAMSNLYTHEQVNMSDESNIYKLKAPISSLPTAASARGNQLQNEIKNNANKGQHVSGGADAGGGNYSGISIEDVKAELNPGLNKLDHEIDDFLTSAYLQKLIDINNLKDTILKEVVTKVLFGFSTQHQSTQMSIGRWNFQEDPTIKNQFDIIINAVRYKTIFLENGNCISKEKEHNLASTQYKLGSPICLSLSNLTRYSRTQLLEIVLPIIFHEIAHQYGFNEIGAKKFENYIRNLYEKYKILNLNTVLKNQLKKLLNKNNLDPLDIARAYELKGSLFAKIKDSNFIDLFLLKNLWGNKEAEELLTQIYRPRTTNIWQYLAPNGYTQHYSVDPLVIDDPKLKCNPTENNQITLNDELSILFNSTKLIELILRTNSTY